MKSASHLSLLDKYTQKFQPHIFIISMPCTGMKGFSGINRQNAPIACKRSLDISTDLANIGAKVAMRQMDEGRHFLAEHPQGSEMWRLRLWQKVGAHPQVVDAKIDQCMAGRIGPKSGLQVKKPTQFWASDELLVKHLRPLVCDGSHKHANLDGSDPSVPQDRAKNMAQWPQPLCRRLANGCGELLHREKMQQSCALPLLTAASPNCSAGLAPP